MNPNSQESSLFTENKNKKLIKLAKYAGFCHGVKRAVDLSIKIKSENPDIPVYILGQLIHNNQVIDHLSKMGIKTINEIPEKLDGICIIRTHGATPQTIKQLEEKGCQIIDATCPDVKRVQDNARTLAESGYKVIIIGKADHPEVIAIKAHADQISKTNAIVISSCEEVESYLDEIKSSKKIGIVIQTTQKAEIFSKIVPAIAENSKELKIYNTICSATYKRQREAKALAKEVELMVVVGNKSSANTTHLSEIIGQDTTTIHIETHKELDLYKDLLSRASKIGITAGASTPDYVINEVIYNIGEQN